MAFDFLARRFQHWPYRALDQCFDKPLKNHLPGPIGYACQPMLPFLLMPLAVMGIEAIPRIILG